MSIHPLAGQPAPVEKLLNVSRLLADYYTKDAAAPVSFGTSGHRGSAMSGSFNEIHVAAVAQATAEYRQKQQHRGPLFLGFDTHGLSEAAFRTVLEVMAANGVPTHIHANMEYTPTPVISFLIIDHNRHHPAALADGLIITPSHNPPQDGGIKYNPPHGGPADVDVTNWIEKRANELIQTPQAIKRISYEKALKAPGTAACDFMSPFVNALGDVVDLKAVKDAGLKLGTDPLGGSGVHFWSRIAEHWGLDINVVNQRVDAAFSFMTLDSDGAIRMDCSSPYAMASLIKTGSRFDLAFGNDPDFDRHGIVSGGELMNPNHYLAVAINYLLRHRPGWPQKAAVGKTLVSSSILDLVIQDGGRSVYETPVGFKWFVEGLSSSQLVFGGEESAGASFIKMDGSVWTTDKDGFCMALLGAEIIAKTGKLPHEIYSEIASRFGQSYYRRVDAELKEEEKNILKTIDPAPFVGTSCAGQKIKAAYTTAPGNKASIGGLKVVLADSSWFAMRPSGTEPKMKLYAESFSGEKTWVDMTAEAPKLVFG